MKKKRISKNEFCILKGKSKRRMLYRPTRTLNAVQVCQVHYSLKSFYFNIVPDQICPELSQQSVYLIRVEQPLIQRWQAN